MQTVAQNVVYENGYDYKVNAQVVNMYFNTRYYDNYTMPAGIYDALRITVGDGKGHNWWCVMFPPLCFVDVTSSIVPEDSKALLKDNLDNEEYDLITADTSSVSNMSIKFKIIEMVENS